MNPLSLQNFNQIQVPQKKVEAESLNKIADKKLRLQEAAKKFEAVLLNTLVNEMQKTVGESGFLDTGQTKQIRGMFWQFMSDEISGNGGIGLADQLYKEFSSLANIDQNEQPHLECKK